MRTRNVIIGVAMISSLSAPSSAKKPETPAVGTVVVESVAYSGDGCPDGSVATHISPDAEAFTVIFSRFLAEVGPVAAATTARRQCKLHVKLSVPHGWSYALSGTDFRGYATLDAGVVATRQSTYHMSGESPETTAQYRWQGAFDDDYVVRDLGGDAAAYWSRCGGGKNLMITTIIDVDGRTGGTGVLDVDSIDGEVHHLIWRRCG
ncbi:MAG: hypothetical protein JWN44_665 [Myxococcales bacterium]|nr:hypothetical protein [Myxococcales bacterium]